MFGGSGKLGRGGGGGRGSKRGIHSPLPPPPPLRPGGPNSSRIPIGASSSSSRRNQPSAGSAAPPTPEETFSLITSEPPAYAMIIRLAPDLVREIKSLEAQGHSARIKFGPNPNNPSGNVIDVGGKDFRFTWSLELGDLCNIYEERQSGEDGNGLLVESGSAWRKLNVQRILDESTRDHVKMLSEEAERLSKSRKAIVLDPGNPSVKNQAKTYVAAGVESNSRRPHFKQKEFFKKRKVEPSQAAVAAPPKPVYKSSTFLMGTVKNRLSVSPLPSPPEQAAASASPFGNGNPSRDQTGVDEFIAPQVKGKDDAANSEKDISGKSVCATTHELAHLKGNLGSTPMDLRNVLVTLLMENPKGMSLKALEKAVGETIPNSGKKIETIIKTIATFQAPGRYILRPGVEKESFKKSSPESGSSPELPHVQTPADSGFPEKAPLEEFGQQAQLSSKAEEFSVLEKNKTHEDSPDNFLTNSKMGNSSSSDSESESDSGSDSSDSGSDSGSQSRSKSRSPVRSGSASSSDSESDGTSSSREGSDVAVDIMASDDEKEVNLNLQAPVPLLLTASPISASNSKDVEKSDDMVNEIEFNKMSPVDNKIETYKENGMEMDVNIELGSYDTNPRTSEDGVPISMDHSKQPESPHVAYVGSSVNENDEQTIKQSLDIERQIELDSSKYEESGNNVRNPKGKTKRVSEKMQEKSENNKRSKSGQPGSFAQPLGIGRSRDTILSERVQFEAHQDPNKRDHAMQISESVNRDGSSSRSMHAQDKSYMIKDRGYREIQDEEMMAANKVGTKNGRENSLGRSVDPQYRKSGEQSGKLSKDAGPSLHGHMTSDPNIKQDAEKRPSVNGKEAVLRRELSDLELGEFREPIPGEETQEVKRQFERKNSFKLVDNRTNTAGNSSYDVTKGRNGEKAIQELKKQSLPGLRVGIQGIQDERLDSARPQHKTMPSQTQQFPRVGHAVPEALPQLDKSADGKAGKNEVRESEGIALEGHMSAYKKTPISLLNHDTKITVPTGNSGTSKETRPQKSNHINDLADKIKDSSWMETVSGSGRRRESSSDEDDSFYSKYERDMPELKGPIRDFSQYQEYLQEYEEKFNCYMSLYKIIENVRDEFLKIGQDLENAKGDIEYKKAMARLMKAYRRFGERDKRMKKVFVVLHEEGKQIKERLMEYALSH